MYLRQNIEINYLDNINQKKKIKQKKKKKTNLNINAKIKTLRIFTNPTLEFLAKSIQINP